MTADPMAEINLQVMWKRLLSVVEEQAQTLVRTAFSTSSREAGDISAGLRSNDDQPGGWPKLARPHPECDVNAQPCRVATG